MSDALELLTRQFLAWIAERPRSYTATMEAWRTSCPRLPVWEDATLQGLVRLKRGDGQTIVALTARGRAVLDSGDTAPVLDAPPAALFKN